MLKVTNALTQHPLGYAQFRSHYELMLHDALCVDTDRFCAIIDETTLAFNSLDKFSEAIETLCERLNGSELVLALLVFGQLMAEYRAAIVTLR